VEKEKLEKDEENKTGLALKCLPSTGCF